MVHGDIVHSFAKISKNLKKKVFMYIKMNVSIFWWVILLVGFLVVHWESSAGYLRSTVTALGCRIVVSALSGKSSTGFYVVLWFARHSRIVISSASLPSHSQSGVILANSPSYLPAHLRCLGSTLSPLQCPALSTSPKPLVNVWQVSSLTYSLCSLS